MKTFPAALERLSEQFARLPGIGSKTAQRLAFQVLSMPQEQAQEFADAILDAKRTVHTCPVCQNLTDQELCGICADSTRDHTTICVVAEPRDVIAMERSREYTGVSSFCNDVIGDICGVISGSAAATIAARVLAMHPGMREIVLTLAMSALAAGLTVGGKACGKSFAIDSSTSVVRTAAMVLHFFHTIPEKLRPKRRR